MPRKSASYDTTVQIPGPATAYLLTLAGKAFLENNRAEETRLRTAACLTMHLESAKLTPVAPTG